MKDALVAEQCRAVSDLLDAHGNTLLDLIIAKAIGARVGWSKQRVDFAAKYVDALQAEVERVDPGSGSSRWSCAGLLASNAYLRERSSRGEVPALRDRLEQSGESVRELAQQHQQYIERIMGHAVSGAAGNEQPSAGPQ